MADTRETLQAQGILDDYVERLAEASTDVRVTVQPLAQQLNLRVDASRVSPSAVEAVLGVALPGALSAVTSPTGATVIWLGPDEWLVVDPSRSTSLEGELRAAVGDGGAVVDQSGQRLSLLVEGDARGLLAKGVAFDLHPSGFPEGTALQGLLAQAVVIFVSRSADASRIELIVRTSFARYVADWVLDALLDPLAYPAPLGG
ncbi:sarcosine oxidase subunit gamma [Microbacterium sp. B2969]|uniref:Sarcosine oxidase subunit gamma n=1 Tax=Microbacterium alkaliflavum TaxID=3248839 RepID=A0ABW7QCE7_9MICO